MRQFLLVTLLLWTTALQAGLPPTSSKVSPETTYPTTFKTNYGFMEGTRSGTTLTVTGLGRAKAKSLDIDSYTTAQMNALTPTTGEIIYNSDYGMPAFYTGSVWAFLGFGNLTIDIPWTNYGVFTADTTLFGQGTMTGGTTPCKYRVASAILYGHCDFTGGTVTGSLGAILLPSGYTIDTSRLIRTNTTSGDGDLVGRWATNGANTLGNIVTAPGTASDRVYIAASFNNALMLRPASPSTYVASGANWSLNFAVPVTGISANTNAWVLANSNPITTTEEFTAAITSAGVVTEGNGDWINGNAAITGTSVFTLTLNSGIFTVAPHCQVTSTAGNAAPEAPINATVTTSSVAWETRTSNGTLAVGSTIIKCTRTGADWTAAHSPFIIGTFAGYTPNSDQVAVRAYASATSISGSLATVVWTTEEYDTHSAFASGVFTCPVAGRYSILSNIQVTGTIALNSTLNYQAQKNGTVFSEFQTYAGGAMTAQNGQINDGFSCAVGDTIRVQLSSSATLPVISTSNSKNFIAIYRTGI